MCDEEMRNCIDLCFYRIERAQEDLLTAKDNYSNEKYRAANNRAYYSIFHSLRSVLALESFDSKKHSGIISVFRKNYIKTGIFSVEISDMIESAFEVRNASDYNDMYVASKSQTEAQIRNAEYVLKEVQEYIGLSVSAYQKLFDEQGNNKDSQMINMLLASLFSSDTLKTVYDCERSERELMKLIWAIDESNLSDEMKDYWREKIEHGMNICQRDHKEMVSQGSE